MLLDQSVEVAQLESNPEYVRILSKTVKQRKRSKELGKFKTMRGPIRTNAVAARQAYVLAAQATPDTPLAVESMVAADTWEAITELTDLLKTKGWFKAPPKTSMLLNEPACAWLTAGVAKVSLRSSFLPALNKHVLRKVVQAWISNHFVLPVGGTDKEGVHHNMMERFVTYTWAKYTMKQRPKVPAMTDVGRFLFTYIWRYQHTLMR